jgi:ribose/xylose/arabinose/galactoside ABC-type transport system permease subunit
MMGSDSAGGLFGPVVFMGGAVGAAMGALKALTADGLFIGQSYFPAAQQSLVLAGVSANRYHVGLYVLAGAMAGFAALLLTGRMSSGHPTAAIGMEFDAIAAVIVGGTSFERGKGSLGGTLVGVVTIGVLKNGLNVLEVASSLQVASIGVLTIVALVIESFLGPATRRAWRSA